MGTHNPAKISDIDDALRDLHPGECLIFDYNFICLMVALVEHKAYTGEIDSRVDFVRISLQGGKRVYWFHDEDVIWYRKQREDDEEFQRKVMVNML